MKFLKISWHRWPILNSIISIYECVMYLFFVCAVGFLYIKVQEVPIHSSDFYFYRLSYGDDRINPQDSTIRYFHAKVTFRLPMTDALYVDSVTQYGLAVAPYLLNKDKRDTIYVTNSKSSLPGSELIQAKKDLSSMLEGNYRRYSWFYIKIKQKHSLFKQFLRFKSFPSWMNFGDFFEKTSYDGQERVYYLMTRASDVYKVSGSNAYHHLVKPSIFSLYDMSQSYYNISLNGEFDRGYLEIDCTGATDFSEMYPQPDLTTMSSIIFTNDEKIRIIKRNGLKFHAEFKELKNKQNARVFVLSAVMSALIAIFVTFLIMAIYKISLEVKSKKGK